MNRKKKFYVYKDFDNLKHIAFTDGSAVIYHDDGSMTIIESQPPYKMSNLFYKFDDFRIALN